MSELEELKLAYAECSRQRNELLNKLKSQAQRKPLTDEQIDAIWDAVITPSNHIREFARAIEAKLRSKNEDRN
jgi:hypothetical protein